MAKKSPSSFFLLLVLNIRPTRLRPFPLMPPEIAHTDKYSENICFCCREIFFNLIYSPFFWRTGSFVEENWGVKFVSTHQPGKRALCAKYSTHTKTFPSPPEIGTFPIFFGIFEADISLHQNFIRHGSDSVILLTFLMKHFYTIELILLESSPVFVLLQDFVLLQRQKLP